MKKFFALVMAFCLIFSMTACGSKTADDGDAAAENTAQYPAESTLHISDNLPDIYFFADYNDYGDSLAEDFAGYQIDKAFAPVNPEDGYVAIYRWKNEEKKTLLEAAKADIAAEENSEYVEPVECDEFYKEGDFHYAYYVLYVEDDAEGYYIQDYYFNDGDDIVVYEYATPAKQVELAENIVFNMPNFMKEAELTEKHKKAGIINSFIDEDYDEFPGFDVYYLDKEGNDIDAVIQYYQDNYEVDDFGKFDVEGTPAVWFELSSEYEGTDYYVQDIVLELDEKYIIFDFYSAKDKDEAYRAAAIAAMQYALGEK